VYGPLMVYHSHPAGDPVSVEGIACDIFVTCHLGCARDILGRQVLHSLSTVILRSLLLILQALLFIHSLLHGFSCASRFLHPPPCSFVCSRVCVTHFSRPVCRICLPLLRICLKLRRLCRGLSSSTTRARLSFSSECPDAYSPDLKRSPVGTGCKIFQVLEENQRHLSHQRLLTDRSGNAAYLHSRKTLAFLLWDDKLGPPNCSSCTRGRRNHL
jgi:hypothetical protein